MQHQYYRTHPFTIFTHLKVSVILLLIPLLKQLILMPNKWYDILTEMSINTIYALVAVGYAVYSYRRYMYRLGPVGIDIKKGLLIQKYFTLPYHNIHTINIYRYIYSPFINASRLSFDSPGGSGKKYDISAFFSDKYADMLIEKLTQGKQEKHVYQSNHISMLLMCAFWSNPATGLLFAAPFISKLGSTASYEIRHLLYDSMNIFWNLFTLKMSPVAAIIADILIAGWAIAFMLQYSRYGRFSASKIGKYIVVARGIFNRSITYTRYDKLAAVTINQSLLMRFFGLYNAGWFSIGSGKLKGDKSLIIAAEKKDKIYRHIYRMTNVSLKEEKIVRPMKYTLYAYICLPLYITAGVMAGLITADYFSAIDEIFKVIMIFALIPLVWWIMFRIYAYRHSRLAINQKCVIVNGFRKWTMQKYIIPFSRIQYVSMTQSLLQKTRGTCNFFFFFYFKKSAFHTVIYILIDEARKITKEINSRIK